VAAKVSFYHFVDAGGLCGLMVFLVLRNITGNSLRNGSDVLLMVVPGMIVVAGSSTTPAGSVLRHRQLRKARCVCHLHTK
jgi:hypothetical protein